MLTHNAELLCDFSIKLHCKSYFKLEPPLSSDESRSNTVMGYHVKDVRFQR
jgi:hypothetical protein